MAFTARHLKLQSLPAPAVLNCKSHFSDIRVSDTSSSKKKDGKPFKCVSSRFLVISADTARPLTSQKPSCFPWTPLLLRGVAILDCQLWRCTASNLKCNDTGCTSTYSSIFLPSLVKIRPVMSEVRRSKHCTIFCRFLKGFCLIPVTLTFDLDENR